MAGILKHYKILKLFKEISNGWYHEASLNETKEKNELQGVVITAQNMSLSFERHFTCLSVK